MADAAVRRPDYRAWILGALIAALCAVFWLDSRYPSLQGKASADPDEALSTPLGFEKHWAEPGTHEPVKHVLWSAAEWAITNKQGMTFGLLFAAGLLTLVPLLPAARGGRFAGSVQGALLGTPLGVCVNCAAPIGQAMLKAGSRTEIALATMFASPSFNVIVIGILFSLFPFYLVALKIAASALMVLVVVPQLARLAERPGWRRPPNVVAAPSPPGLRLFQWLGAALIKADAALVPATGERPGLAGSLAWVALHYARNLWTVIRLALPLMLLAGLIGAAMAELLPWGRLAEMAHVSGWVPNVLALAVIAAFGVLLPVPMAFDVIVCAVLWNAGVPPHVVAALLVTLGIYSVYPWTLIGTTLSWRVAAAAGAAVWMLGMLAGAGAGVLNGWHELRLARTAASLLAALPVAVESPVATHGPSPAAGAPALPLAPPRIVAATADAQLEYAPPVPVTATAGATAFRRIEGAALGLERPPLPRPYLVMEPSVMHLGALAADDIDGDGWTDLALGTATGVALYRNLGGRYARVGFDLPVTGSPIVTALAFADLDGDGAPDLVACHWMQSCQVRFNRGGGFGEAAPVELPRGTETAVQSLAFADVDRDGDLDLVTGAVTYVPRFFYPRTSVNRLWRNDGRGGFAPEPLAGPQGETLTLLFHDFDDDGWPDLYVGNDFDEPDQLYRNERGTLRPLPAAQAPVPRTTHDTMSADAGDLDNDGRDELYLGGISMGSAGAALAARVATPLPSCEVYAELADRARCDSIARFQLATFTGYSVQSLAPCEALAGDAQKRDCVVSAYHWNRVLARLPVLGADRDRVLDECAQIPDDYTTMRDICAAIRDNEMDGEGSDTAFPDSLPQVRQTNLLYRAGAEGLTDVTGAWKAGLGGWTWSARFADLDNDGWQDLFITQGTRLRPNSPSAVWYRNEGGQRFTDQARAAGLADHNPTGAAVFVDFDRDGDLDIITQPFLLAPVFWRNDRPVAPGIEITLDDPASGNRRAIGARIELRTGAGGAVQARTLRASGGYQSHDPPAAHLAVPAGGATLTVTWPDGASSQVRLDAWRAGRYRVTRAVPSK